MSNKNKNRKLGTWSVIRLFLLGLVLFVLGLAIQSKKTATLEAMEIEVTALSDNKYLINKKDVHRLILDHLGYEPNNINIKNLDLHQLEKMIERDQRVDEAQLYVDKHNRLHVKVNQKVPVVRIEDKSSAYYLDKRGSFIPTVEKVAVRVPIATGNIGSYDELTLKKKGTVLHDLLQMVNYISEDDFLLSLVEQIDVEDDGEMIIVPKVGRNTIEFGNIDHHMKRHIALAAG